MQQWKKSSSQSGGNRLYQNCFDIRRALPHGACEALDHVHDMLDSSSAFSKLDTKYKREKYMEQELGAVMPKPVLMGEHVVHRKRKGLNKVTTKKQCGYFVPFLPNLQALLSMPEVGESLKNSIAASERLMTDVIDGSFLRNSTFLDKHPDALLLAAYSDDFELINPIGSHTRHHKLCVFYYILLNIPPEFRSKLSAIQLIGVAKSADIKKHGTEILLKDFLTGLRSLYNGITLSICGTEMLFHGLLAFYMGDTPAAQAAGGFKHGVARAKSLAVHVTLKQVQ